MGKKSIITVHGHFDREWAQRGHARITTLCRKIGRQYILHTTDLFVVNDRQIGIYLAELGVEQSRLYTRYVFADTMSFSRDNIDMEQLLKFQRCYGLPQKYILYVGDFTKWDGADDMLRVFKTIHEKISAVNCVMVGKGPLQSWVKAFIAENHLDSSVTLIDNVSFDMMPYIYCAAELVILPNHPPQGGVGRTNLEALSMEVPVITYDIGEMHRVIINDETGYRVPEGDLYSMADRALLLLTKPEMKKAFGKNGRWLVQKEYDVNGYIDNWLKTVDIIKK